MIMEVEDALKEAKQILDNKRKLLKKYPDKFSLKLSVRQWSHRVHMCEIELKELKTDKYFMSSKSLKMWIEQTGSDTYKDRPIEVDDSIPYGAVEPHIEYD